MLMKDPGFLDNIGDITRHFCVPGWRMVNGQASVIPVMCPG